MIWNEGEWDDEPWPEADEILPGGWIEEQLKLAILAQRRGHATNLPDLQPIAWWLLGETEVSKEEQNVVSRRPILRKDFTPKFGVSNGVNGEDV